MVERILDKLFRKFYIGGEANPYLVRWFVIQRNSWFNVYIHKFVRDDDDRALHDHPWWFVSILLSGGYFEHGDNCGGVRQAPSIAFRRADHRHRIELFRTPVIRRLIPAWTLVLTGRKSRTWGFWCPKGFVPWYNFVDHTDEGNIGKGCGES